MNMKRRAKTTGYSIYMYIYAAYSIQLTSLCSNFVQDSIPARSASDWILGLDSCLKPARYFSYKQQNRVNSTVQ